MTRIKTVRVPASDDSAITKFNLHHPHAPASHQTPQEPDPVSKVPYHQHTYADGTTTAPNWNPRPYDPSDADRSWEDSVKQLNPAGDPTHARKQREDFDLPQEPVTTVSFENGRKIVTHAAKSPAPMPAMPHRNNPAFKTRRRVVGGKALYE